jgi:hypothetical protein
MLTRCKAGLVIVTNRIFLRTTGAQYSLLGNLARHWTQRHGDSETWRDWKEIAEHKADMPGAPIPRRSNTSIINPTTSLAAPRPPPPSRVVPATVSLVFPSASGTLKTNPIAPIINAFPDLGASGVPKNTLTIKGRWSNPAGVNAIKRVGTSIPSQPVGRAETQVQPPLATQAKQQLVAPTRFQDHFPMLENVRVEKVKSRRENSRLLNNLAT